MTPTWLLLEVTAILTLALVGVRLARNSRAAVRHVLLAGAFAVLLILPLASMVAPVVRVEVPASVHAAIAPLDLEFDDPTIDDASRPPVSDAVSNAQAPAEPASPNWSWPSLSTLLLATWIAGTALFLIPVLVGLWQVRMLRKSGLPWRNGGAAVGALAQDAGIHRGIDVLLHESVPGPMTCGVLHPAIVLPNDAERWAPEDLTRAIVHELEHVRRVDWISHCLARIVAACYWFHPIVWIAWRQLVLEAERACDDAVLRRSEATAYADQLVILAHRLSAASSQPQLAMANRRDLHTRVLAVLDSRQRRGRAGAFAVTVAIAACALLVMTMSPLRIVAASAGAQDAAASAKQEKFDVVSIKPCDALRPQGGRGVAPGAAQVSPGYVHWDCVTLSQLIDLAYTGRANPLLNSLPSSRPDGPKRVRGGPSWVDSERFTIEARASAEVSSAGPGRNPMTTLMNLPPAMSAALREMLADRFQLKLRRETEERPMYALTVAKGGLGKDKVKLFVPGSCWPGKRGEETPPPGFERLPKCSSGAGVRYLDNGNRRIEYSTYTMKNVALNLSDVMDRYVIDKTELEGQFSFAIEFAADESTPNGDARGWAEQYAQAGGRPAPDPSIELPTGDGTTIFKALEALGLKLEPTKGPAEYFAIDSVQKPRPDEPAPVAAVDVASAATPDGSSVQQSAGASTQTTTSSTSAPKFDVVSIKPCAGLPPAETGRGAAPSSAQMSPGYVRWACVTVTQLIDQAYAGAENPLLNIVAGNRAREDSPKRVRGGPSWVDDERFTIEAKSASVVPTNGDFWVGPLRGAPLSMLRALLEDRFQLKLRRATEQQPMYAITLSKAGLKLKPTDPGDCWVRPAGTTPMTPAPAGFEGKRSCGTMSGFLRDGNQFVEATGITLNGIARYLSGVMDRYVVDQTGVDGMFNFPLEYAPDDHTPAREPKRGASAGVEPEPAPRGKSGTIFKALEALGLKLDPIKGPAEYLQIDSIQRPKPNQP